MVALTVQEIVRTGLNPTLAAASAGGDTFVNDGRTWLRAKNAHATLSRTVTVDSKVNCDQGSDHNVAVTVPALGERWIGPFPTTRFSETGTVTYDSEADLTVAAVKMAAT